MGIAELTGTADTPVRAMLAEEASRSRLGQVSLPAVQQ